MQRYELAPESRKLVEVHDGPWVFYADVELLQAQLANARKALRLIASCKSTYPGDVIDIAQKALAGGRDE